MAYASEFESARALLESTLSEVLGSTRGSLSEGEYQQRVELADKVFKLLWPASAQFREVVCGVRPASAIGHLGPHNALCFPERFLKAASTASLPSEQRQSLERVLEDVLLLGLVCQLVIWQFPTRGHVERVDVNALASRWNIEALVADRKLAGWGKTEQGQFSCDLLFDHLWRTSVQPMLKGDLGIGFWAMAKCRSYFRNLFYAGALLGVSFDLLTTDEGVLEKAQANQQRTPEPIDLVQLRKGFRGKRYGQLVEHHVKRLSKQVLFDAVGGTIELLPERVRPLMVEAVDDWNLRAYDAAFWRRDCAEVFDEIVQDMATRLADVSVQHDDETLFNMFQVVTMSYAYSVTDQPEMRKFMGIRKGLFS